MGPSRNRATLVTDPNLTIGFRTPTGRHATTGTAVQRTYPCNPVCQKARETLPGLPSTNSTTMGALPGSWSSSTL